MKNSLKNNPIGVFDSGLGGLTAIKVIKEIMPHENVVYFGDTKRVPYGVKSKTDIIQYTNQDISFLKSQNSKIIISACGTASSYLSDSDNIVGVIYPACKKAFEISNNKRIGIIGTTAAIESNSYLNQIKKISDETFVLQKSCPMFVPLIERGITHLNNNLLHNVTKFYLKDFVGKIDTLILGCTHYPLIKETINDFFDGTVNLINPGKEAAILVKKILKNSHMENNSTIPGRYNFYVSANKQAFSNSAKIFLNFDIEKNLKTINIDSY